jgi:cell division protein ZapA (FtsZ GTPase activity inhibitor)
MKSKLGRLLHEYGTSSNSLKKALTNTVLAMGELVKLKEKIAKANTKVQKEEEQSLLIFVGNKNITGKLDTLNINSKLFKKEMVSNFIYNQNKLILFMENFINLVDELERYKDQGFKLDPKNYKKVASKLNLSLPKFTSKKDYIEHDEDYSEIVGMYNI